MVSLPPNKLKVWPFNYFSPKKCFFLRKHDFSWKWEGGTGLQGVSSNLNIRLIRIFCYNNIIKSVCWFAIFRPVTRTRLCACPVHCGFSAQTHCQAESTLQSPRGAEAIVTLLLCYSVTRSLCYSVTLLLCYSVTLLLCYSVTLFILCLYNLSHHNAHTQALK